MKAANLFSNDCACPPASPQGACTPPGYPQTFLRGQLPLVVPFCPGDTCTQPGRINALWVPEFVVEQFFAEGAAYAPSTPLSDTDTFTSSPVTLTIAAAAAQRVLTPGIIIDLMSSNNVSPGITEIALTGTFDGGGAYTQTVQLSTARVGLSRFALLFSREVQGGAYPNLVQIANAFVTGTVDIDSVPTNVTQTSTLSLSVTSVPGTSIRVETMSPVSELWYQVISAWYANAQPYAPRRS